MMTSTVTPPQPAPVDHERATRLAGIVKDWLPIKDDPDMGNLARAYLAKCDEVEKLKRNCDRLNGAFEQEHVNWHQQFNRAEVAEARTATLLEALEIAETHVSNYEQICKARLFLKQEKSSALYEALLNALKIVRAAIAAAKGETA